MLPAILIGAYLYLGDAQAVAPAPPPAVTHPAVVSLATAIPTLLPTATRPGLGGGGALACQRGDLYRNLHRPGAWRIRWRLAAPTELFQLMIDEGLNTPILLTGSAGATEGVFEETRGGTFRLMLHNTIPYEVIVEEFRGRPECARFRRVDALLAGQIQRCWRSSSRSRASR